MLFLKLFHRFQRILILSLLSISVCAPIILVSRRLNTISSIGRKEFIEDISSTRVREDFRLNAIEQESGEGFRNAKLVYEDRELGSVVSNSSSNTNYDYNGSRNAEDATDRPDKIGSNHNRKEENQQFQQTKLSSQSRERYKQTTGQQDENIHSESQRMTNEKIKKMEGKQSNQAKVSHDLNMRSHLQRRTDGKIKEIKDQLIIAKVYLSFASPGSHLEKELKLQIRELQSAVGDATRDSDLPRRAYQKMRYMQSSLSKASRIYPDCSMMAKKLRAMTHNVEEKVRAQREQASYLVGLAARTTPKGLHCLSMQLTADYFGRQPAQRQLPNQQKLNDIDLYHYAVFSDNVLACAVVVNSTVSTAMESERVVFHVVTDSLNLPAFTMWFLQNPPGKAAISIRSIDDFEWLSTDIKSRWGKYNSSDPRYTSKLNYLRFYLPNLFPTLNKILLLDHDVVVQKDLSALWSVDMKGKVNGAVETCRQNETSFHRMDTFINFSDPFIATKFDVNSCTWAFGMNLFDLNEWRKRNLTDVFQDYLQLGYSRPVLKVGSLPLGWITFYNQTVALDKHWHIVGLGYDSGVEPVHIDKSAVLHYDGLGKPWLDIASWRYKGYWSRYVNYDHPYLRRCNIQG